MTQCVDIKMREGGRTRLLGSLFCRGIWRRLLGIYLFSKYVSSYLFVFGHKNSISPSNNNHNNYSRGWGGENVALGPCLRLRFAFVLTQLDSTWLGLAWPGWDGCCCCCCCPSLESSNEFSARLHLKRRALKLPLVSSSPCPSIPSEFLKV